jgi:hypothetical protein
LELVDAGVVPGGGREEYGRGRIVSGALTCQLQEPIGLCHSVPVDGRGVCCAGAVELLLKAVCSAKDLA